jgi:hypothetical protein
MITLWISVENYAALEEQEFKVRHAYSGRGMYGEECFALVGTVHDLLTMVNTIHELGLDIDTDLLASNVKMDNMASEFVFYWPAIGVSTNS